MRYAITLHLALWNVLCLGLVGLAWAYGMVADVFMEDASHTTWIMAALMAFVLIYTTARTFRYERAAWELDGYSVTPTLDKAVKSVITEEMQRSARLPNFLKSKVFLFLGLAGTLIGLLLFAKHMAVNGGNATPEAITGIMDSMRHSLETAFNASLVGIGCKLWTEVIVFIQGTSTRQLSVAP